VIQPGGVHIKYLHHSPRQLWLYTRGIRPEHLSERVQLGEAVSEPPAPQHDRRPAAEISPRLPAALQTTWEFTLGWSSPLRGVATSSSP
jgi:hypothetical protein